ncbi:hypothetical protein J6TS1_45640 [Siminovitchia terrae]|uniref:Uncharacterized protein n=1 Tax=Siminovitchia terrae TaxID=1914933 RepID=A0ABQ4L476_SIMTE|nr:hypothetical protein J6TS1_45640 [Siminovitchia terrae]
MFLYAQLQKREGVRTISDDVFKGIARAKEFVNDKKRKVTTAILNKIKITTCGKTVMKLGFEASNQ